MEDSALSPAQVNEILVVPPAYHRCPHILATAKSDLLQKDSRYGGVQSAGNFGQGGSSQRRD
jgi:hypothetical protein